MGKIKSHLCRLAFVNKGAFINANLANFRVLLKSLGGFVALDKVDVSHKTSAKSQKGSKAGFDII